MLSPAKAELALSSRCHKRNVLSYPQNFSLILEVKKLNPQRSELSTEPFSDLSGEETEAAKENTEDSDNHAWDNHRQGPINC